jgi:chromosome segregation ATPase
LRREQGQGRFSIDLSLELERQLAMESPPITPGHDATTHPEPTAAHPEKRGDSHLNDLLPDPEVLANIIMQLRHSLTDVTKERDELVGLLASANSQEANAKDALQVVTDKATEAEEELSALRKKAREQEEQIGLLRAKVEESRYVEISRSSRCRLAN